MKKLLLAIALALPLKLTAAYPSFDDVTNIVNAIGGVITYPLAATTATNLQNSYNVELFGSKHTGHYVIGNITNGTSDVYLAAGSVLTNDALVDVKCGGATNNDFVSTLASWVSSSHFILSAAATNTITSAYIYLAQADDAGAIQAAVNYAATNGGGNVVFPGGNYWLSHSINIPDYTYPNVNDVYTTPTISLNGVGPSSGVGFGSDLTYSGNSALLVDCEPKGTGTNDSILSVTNWTFARFRVEAHKLLFRTPTQPNMMVINLKNANSAVLDQVIVDSGFTEYDPAIPIPMTNTVAVFMPMNGNSGAGQSTVSSCLIMAGFNRGLIYSDHADIQHLCVSQCNYGIAPFNPIDSCIVDYDFEGCNYGIDGNYVASSPKQPVVIFLARCENNAGSGWSTNGAGLFYDPNDLLVGKIDHFINVSSLSGNVGGQYLSWSALPAASYQPGYNYNTETNLFIAPVSAGSGLIVSNQSGLYAWGGGPLYLGIAANGNGGIASFHGVTSIFGGVNPAGGSYSLLVDDTNGQAEVSFSSMGGNVTALGNITANTFTGNGGGVTNILATAMRATNSPSNGYALRYTNGTFYWAP
jgi:hypothetical protein